MQRNEPSIEIDAAGMWWIGHASGFTLVLADGGLWLEHRCGASWRLRNYEYLANIIDGPVMMHRRTGCSAPVAATAATSVSGEKA